MSMDISIKRGRFIAKVNSLLQEFHYASPKVLMKFMQTYACNIYGTNNWDLFSSDCQRVFTSYNVAVRNIFKLPRTTHRYLLEPVSESPHLLTQLLSRYCTFAQSLIASRAFEVRFLARLCLNDMRTVLGRTMTRIALLCDRKVEDIRSTTVLKNFKYALTPENEIWRIGVIKNMLDIISKSGSNVGLTDNEASQILEFACSS